MQYSAEKSGMALINETRVYYKDNLPYTFVYDPTLEEGKIDYEKETLTVRFKAAMILNSNIFDDERMLENALYANPGYKDWGLDTAIEKPTPILFARVSIVNGKGEVIGDARSSFDTRGKDGAKYLYYDYISATISASKDWDGMRIRIDGIQSDGKNVAVGIFTKDEYVDAVLKPSLMAMDSGNGNLPPAVKEIANYFGWEIASIYLSIPGIRKEAKWTWCFKYHIYTYEDGTSMAVIEGLADGMHSCEPITIPHTIEGVSHVYVNSWAFERDTRLKSVTIGDGSSDSYCGIGLSAFAGCTSLESLIVHGDARLLFSLYAFKNCTSLKDVIIDSSANCFWGGKDIFKGCKSLSKESKAPSEHRATRASFSDGKGCPCNGQGASGRLRQIGTGGVLWERIRQKWLGYAMSRGSLYAQRRHPYQMLFHL